MCPTITGSVIVNKPAVTSLKKYVLFGISPVKPEKYPVCVNSKLSALYTLVTIPRISPSYKPSAIALVYLNDVSQPTTLPTLKP